MNITVLHEAGYEEALLGMSLSYYDRAKPIAEWWDEDKKRKAERRALNLAFRQGGHNKFLESIVVWMHVEGTRGWWQEMDTYRVGVTKNSSSTMHTLSKRPTTAKDFSSDTSPEAIALLNKIIDEDPKDILRIKANLPEGFLQDRIICTNYKALQNIVFQRSGHRLRYWNKFIALLKTGLAHHELIFNEHFEM